MIDQALVRRAVSLLNELPAELSNEGAFRLAALLRTEGLVHLADTVEAGERSGQRIAKLGAAELSEVADRKCPTCGR